MIDLKVKLKVINLLKRTGEYEKWLEEGRTEEDMKERWNEKEHRRASP